MVKDNLVCEGYLGIKHESHFNCVWVNSASAFTNSFALPEMTLTKCCSLCKFDPSDGTREAYSDVGVQELF